MSVSDTNSKVSADHLRRDAYLYVRQSSLHQVMNNTESSRRQYDLRNRAIALGWPLERVIVIDIDQGMSGASAADREGFQRLVADVSLGKSGIVLGLECSRLARNNADWHRLPTCIWSPRWSQCFTRTPTGIDPSDRPTMRCGHAGSDAGDTTGL